MSIHKITEYKVQVLATSIGKHWWLNIILSDYLSNLSGVRVRGGRVGGHAEAAEDDLGGGGRAAVVHAPEAAHAAAALGQRGGRGGRGLVLVEAAAPVVVAVVAVVAGVVVVAVQPRHSSSVNVCVSLFPTEFFFSSFLFSLAVPKCQMFFLSPKHNQASSVFLLLSPSSV